MIFRKKEKNLNIPKAISLTGLLDKKKKVKILTLFVILVFATAAVNIFILKYPKKPKAIGFTSSSLTINSGELLYIGESGLQSERMWHEDTPSTDLWNSVSRSNANDSGNEIGPNFRLVRQIALAYPTNHIYDPSYLEAMKFNTTVGCPNTVWADNSTTNYTAGGCKAIITDGNGAIIQIDGNITINGTVFLGDRVVLKAKSITLGATGKIIGSGQAGGSASGHDNTAIGGLGAHNGGHSCTQTSNGVTCTNYYGSPIYTCTTATDIKCPVPTPNYLPNNLSYYFPLSNDNTVTSYFTDAQGNLINGGNGSNGGPDNGSGRPYGGQGSAGEIGIGGSGGGGGADYASTDNSNTGAGGGGGGGYGMVMIASSISTNPTSKINFKGGNYGDRGGDRVGYGGSGGGGAVIMKATDFSLLGTVNVSGGDASPSGTVAGGAGAFLRIGSSPKIFKTLSSVQRDGAAATFNVYSLEAGDIIRTQIDIKNLFSAAAINQITDDILKIPIVSGSQKNYQNMTYCKPTGTNTSNPAGASYSYVVPSTDPPNQTVTFTNIASDIDGNATLTYDCKVVSYYEYYH